MAKDSKDILQKARDKGLATPSAGLRVPDGYFDDFNARMAAMLPERPEIEQAGYGDNEPKSLWAKVRPYVYMAAMFAGVWCMLQMFHSIGGASKLQPMTENAALAKALSSDEFFMDYVYDDINSWDILDEMVEDGTIDEELPHEYLIDYDSYADDGDYILPL
ncbi:MAG: hypothetical protein J1F05_04430 [Muribaculaceae bacterium]|nr:hypothetical protein [Muribaculaceae bacterium]